eukprot:5354116-Alexandrium_andersonii.AAC.1
MLEADPLPKQSTSKLYAFQVSGCVQDNGDTAEANVNSQLKLVRSELEANTSINSSTSCCTE